MYARNCAAQCSTAVVTAAGKQPSMLAAGTTAMNNHRRPTLTPSITSASTNATSATLSTLATIGTHGSSAASPSSSRSSPMATQAPSVSSLAKFCTVETGYYSKPTQYQQASYGSRVVHAIRRQDARLLNRLCKAGLSPNPCNRHGDSIIHMVCRRGYLELLQVLLENGATVQCTDDLGRTPLHEACWTMTPNWHLITTLLRHDKHLLQAMDCYGNTPFCYISSALHSKWIEYLQGCCSHSSSSPDGNGNGKSDRDENGGNGGNEDGSVSIGISIMDELWPVMSPKAKDEPPRLTKYRPHYFPVPNPKNSIPLEMVKLIANGKMEPEAAYFYHDDISDSDDDDSSDGEEDSFADDVNAASDDDDDDDADEDESLTSMGVDDEMILVMRDFDDDDDDDDNVNNNDGKNGKTEDEPFEIIVKQLDGIERQFRRLSKDM